METHQLFGRGGEKSNDKCSNESSASFCIKIFAVRVQEISTGESAKMKVAVVNYGHLSSSFIYFDIHYYSGALKSKTYCT